MLPGSAEAVHVANELGYKVFIITNQSGIARGFLSEATLQEIHAELTRLLRNQNAHIDAIYYCPHFPESSTPPYNIECDCRKPHTGMLRKAVEEFDVDLKRSFVIGDRLIDIQTGNNAGTSTILVLTGYGKQELPFCDATGAQIDYVANDLSDAMQFVRQSTLRNPIPAPHP